MKVSELISYLQTVDQDLPVAVTAYEWGATEVRAENIGVTCMAPDKDGGRGSMFGEWELVFEDKPHFKALYITRDSERE